MGTGDVLAQRFAGNGGNIQIQQPGLSQLCLHSGNAASSVQIRHVGGACGSQVAEVRGLSADLVEELHVNRHTGFVSDGQQVQHRVGGAAQGHIAGQGVADGAFVDDLAGGHIVLDQIHDGHTGLFAQLQTLGVNRRDGAVAGQGNADGLAQAVHAVGGVHAGAGTAGRAAVAGAIFQLGVIDHAGLVSADGFKHFGKADFIAAITASQHGAAGTDNGGHIHAHSGHDHAGNDLIAVGHQNQAVQLVGHKHGLHTVADQLAGGEGVLHADMAHGNAIANTDGRNQHRGAARHADACLDGIGQLIQVHMAGNDLTVSRNHADQRAFQLFRGVAQGIEQAAVWGALRAFFNVITSHIFLSFAAEKGHGSF